jgi:succinate dehydrogenase assembly factor 1
VFFDKVYGGTATDQKCRSEFQKNIKIDKRDFAAIEFLLRKGRRQADSYSTSDIKDIH